MKVRSAFAILIFLAAYAAWAQSPNLRLPISLDADSTNYDGKNSMLMFRGLRLSQGTIGVAADEGRASKLDFKDSVWHFTGNVVIDVDNGHIECDSAALRFRDHVLQLATIEGSPATFEIQRPESDQTTYAEAKRLEYNLQQGVIEFSGDARITEGGNQISSAFLVYDIKERRVNAQSSASGDQKVKIIYTPSELPTGDLGTQDTESESDNGSEPGDPDS